ncbi:hypothetical protein D3C74_401600 [compost metagenome]
MCRSLPVDGSSSVITISLEHIIKTDNDLGPLREGSETQASETMCLCVLPFCRGFLMQVAKSKRGMYNDGNELKRRISMIGRVARSIHDSEPGEVGAGMT